MLAKKGKIGDERIILAQDIILENANCKEKRTLMSELKIAPDLKLVYDKTVFRVSNTNFTNDFYRICGTDDVLVIQHNCGATKEYINFDIVDIRRGYYKSIWLYNKEALCLAKRFGLPYELCRALGVEAIVYSRFITVVNKSIPKNIRDDLNSGGILRQKSALYSLFGPNLYSDLKIDEMGYDKTKTIAMYIVTHCA